jgi:hypothetical protein
MTTMRRAGDFFWINRSKATELDGFLDFCNAPDAHM